MADMTNVPPVAPAPATTVPVPPVKYAGFWVRYVAVVIDSIIGFVPSFIVGFMIGLSAALAGIDTHSFSFRIITEGVSIIIVWIYFVLMTYYLGATLGKMLVGIRVESESFGKLSFGKVLLRETVGKFVSGIILYIGYIMAGFTSKKQALHDKFAHSVVIYKNPAKPHGAGLIVGIIIATILPIVASIGILSSIVLASLNVAREKGQAAQMQEMQSQAQIQQEIQTYQ